MTHTTDNSKEVLQEEKIIAKVYCFYVVSKWYGISTQTVRIPIGSDLNWYEEAQRRFSSALEINFKYAYDLCENGKAINYE